MNLCPSPAAGGGGLCLRTLFPSSHFDRLPSADCSVKSSSFGVPLLSSNFNAMGNDSLALYSSKNAADRQPPPKEQCFSLEGYLSMKCLSSALASLLQSRKRHYFGLEEVVNQLVYYRSKTDFVGRKDCLGHISMNGAFCSLVEGNVRAFLLHTENGKKYQLEADNDRAAHCWLNALRQRRETREDWASKGLLITELNGHGLHRTSRSPSVDSGDSEAELGQIELQQQRARTQPYPKRRNLDPLHLELLNGAGLERSKCSSTPPTPKSMPMPRQHNYDKISLTRNTSIIGKSKFGGALKTDGGCCCVCGTRTATKEWVVDSWLNGQRHSGEDGAAERGRLGTTSSGEISPGNRATADAGSPTSASSIRPSASPAATDHPAASPSWPSSIICESAGAYHAPDELMMLRETSNRQKLQIQELNSELERMRMAMSEGTPKGTEIDEHSLAAQNRFLNSELLRINERRLELSQKMEQYKRQIVKIEAEMEDFKKEYVHLLQSCVRIPIRDNSSCDVVQIKLFGGDEVRRMAVAIL